MLAQPYPFALVVRPLAIGLIQRAQGCGVSEFLHVHRLIAVAQAVEYLLDARYVTGANIDVAGGYRL